MKTWLITCGFVLLTVVLAASAAAVHSAHFNASSVVVAVLITLAVEAAFTALCSFLDLIAA